MAGVKFTRRVNVYTRLHGLTAYDIIEVISEFEVIQDDSQQSGVVRAGKVVRNMMVWVVYMTRDDYLVVIDLETREVNE